MSTSSTIRFVRRSELATEKWDRCIDESSNGLVYAYSWYLDHMARQWDALVLEEDGAYTAVMPLTWHRKYTFYYLYQPFLCAQLGVFGKDVTEALTIMFMEAVPKKFKYWDIYFNHQNLVNSQIGGREQTIYLRRNFVLPLRTSYELINEGYRENIRRNIKKAEQTGCRAVKDFDVTRVIALATDQMTRRNEETDDHMARFAKLYQFMHTRGKATTYGILNAREQLVASCIFIFSHNRAYYILVGNHPDGRTMGASHALIDSFIKDHAGSELLLDFEGSDIRNLAFFYSSFGAVEENFPAVKVNRLPFFVRFFKK